MSPSESNAERRVLDFDGEVYVLSGEPEGNKIGPPMDRVLCTVGDRTAVISRLQKFWSLWPQDRLKLALTPARYGRRPSPESAVDAPPEVDVASIYEEWDFGRGYCRAISWRVGGRMHRAWFNGPGWSSDPDMPLGGLYWNVRREGDESSESLTGTEFDPPTDRWWSTAGVVRAAMEALSMGK